MKYNTKKKLSQIENAISWRIKIRPNDIVQSWPQKMNFIHDKDSSNEIFLLHFHTFCLKNIQQYDVDIVCKVHLFMLNERICYRFHTIHRAD